MAQPAATTSLGPGRKLRPRTSRATSTGVRVAGPGQLRIAILAPPWIPVPPPGYGGIETVVALLARELARRGNHVTLFAAPGSDSLAEVRSMLDRPHPEAIERSLYEADHVARAFAAIDAAGRRGKGFDVVHDHCGFTAFAMADRLSTPLVHTLHGPFTPDTYAFYAHHAAKASVVAISRSQLAMAPPELRVAGVVANPIDADGWPLVSAKDDYLLWAGRVTEAKGPHRAIRAARAARLPLVLAGPVQPGQEAFFEREIAPHVDGRAVSYVGEVGGRAKQELFARARGLLMPIRWCEPFGMVMVEAMISGTPVIAFDEGAASELVVEGRTGFLVADEEEMAKACLRLGEIEPAGCRAWVAERCDARRTAVAYEEILRRAATRPPAAAPLVGRAAASAADVASLPAGA